MNTEKNKEKWIQKIIDILTVGERSKSTIDNYTSCVRRFLNYYNNKTNIRQLKEEEILKYIKSSFIDLGCKPNTCNINIKALRYFYSVCFDRVLNKNKLPNVKISKKVPIIIEKKTFIKLVNNEKFLHYKCWLLLAFCCGLRANEVATIKIEDIFAQEHKLKVLGKGKKERYTILPDIVIKYLRLYYKYGNFRFKQGYLFKGYHGNPHVSAKYITNHFTELKKIYGLDKNLTFHSLRHSFATYYLINGGNILTLKSLMGHTYLGTTSIYIHIAQNFNELEGIKYV